MRILIPLTFPGQRSVAERSVVEYQWAKLFDWTTVKTPLKCLNKPFMHAHVRSACMGENHNVWKIYFWMNEHEKSNEPFPMMYFAQHGSKLQILKFKRNFLHYITWTTVISSHYFFFFFFNYDIFLRFLYLIEYNILICITSKHDIWYFEEVVTCHGDISLLYSILNSVMWRFLSIFPWTVILFQKTIEKYNRKTVMELIWEKKTFGSTTVLSDQTN